jgi:hypothetical protein
MSRFCAFCSRLDPRVAAHPPQPLAELIEADRAELTALLEGWQRARRRTADATNPILRQV